MKRVGRLAGKWWLFYPVLASYVALWSLPGSVWFESRTIAISDAEVGMAPVVVEDRTIHFLVPREYTTTTRDVLTGNVTGGCSGSADVRYRGGLDGVNTTNLVDWTDGKAVLRHASGRPVCDRDMPGRHRARVRMGRPAAEVAMLDLQHLHHLRSSATGAEAPRACRSAGGPMKRIIWHWTAGTNKATAEDKEHYHFIIEGMARSSPETSHLEANLAPKKANYAAHTLNCNTGSIGISLAAMAGAVERPFSHGRFPSPKTRSTP